MSTVGYRSPFAGAPLLLAVRCDNCGAELRTRRTDDEVPLHRLIDARWEGWARRKDERGILRDYCPSCARYYSIRPKGLRTVKK